MPRVTVWLDETKVSALTQLAMAERRRPADQAAVIIERALTEPATPQSKEAAIAT